MVEFAFILRWGAITCTQTSKLSMSVALSESKDEFKPHLRPSNSCFLKKMKILAEAILRTVYYLHPMMADDTIAGTIFDRAPMKSLGGLFTTW